MNEADPWHAAPVRRRMKIRIVSDGTPQNTRFYDENGVELDLKVTAIDFHLDMKGFATAKLEFHSVELDSMAEVGYPLEHDGPGSDA